MKIWDYQTKACLQTLEGHSHNVSSVCFHPRLPLIISASEDGTVRLWHSTTYRPETTLNYGLERAWCLAPTKDANKLAIGYDEGRHTSLYITQPHTPFKTPFDIPCDTSSGTSSGTPA